MTEWTKIWPTEPGWYWFYGWPFDGEKKSGREPELNAILVWENGTLVRGSAFWYKSDGGEGLFCKMDTPKLPNVLTAANGNRVLVTYDVPKGGRGGFFHSEELVKTGKAMIKKVLKEKREC
jgi:hypothetical protein